MDSVRWTVYGGQCEVDSVRSTVYVVSADAYPRKYVCGLQMLLLMDWASRMRIFLFFYFKGFLFF